MVQTPEVPALQLARVEALVFRAPVREPVQTSFGIMVDRPAVLVRIEDVDGAVGWGEIWCNFPSVGAEHRARMLESCVAPILLEKSWQQPQDAFLELSRRLHILGIQTGEPGTIAQAIAGADIALWDLAARRAGLPLWKRLGGSPRVGVYASGLSPTDPATLAAEMLALGYRAFKLKVGFGRERDIGNLRTLRLLVGDEARLMVDANQAWDMEEALAMGRLLAPLRPDWLEEPMPADQPLSAWQQLAAQCPVPLAAGENLRGEEAFEQAIASNAFAVIQPDMGKWGGFSGCIPVARKAIAAGRTFCPHWLGGGIGLLASMHLKAAVGGAGYVEVDSNPNPLRELLARPGPAVQDGTVVLGAGAGLGVEPDLQAAAGFRRPHR